MIFSPVLAQIDTPLLLLGPFGLLLLLIAVMPLTSPAAKSWWEKSYPLASISLAAIVAAWYLVKIPGGGVALAHMLGDYFSFICLLGALFVVAGGIHLRVQGEATPLVNVVFLALGACAANLIGTTGASMVLIRPWIRMNKIRAGAYHIVFFIFVVSNIGGALTPIGDPPLFLGYLRGVPFFWLLEHVLPQWLFTLGLVLTAFYFFDRRGYRRMPGKIRHDVEARTETWRLDGAVNVLFLMAIVSAVFLPDKIFLREAVMLGVAAASWFITPRDVHAENHFSFGPLKEIGWLFLGLFITMLPALDYVAQHGRDFGFTRPLHYYFATGALSAVLDNAPTYVNFLQLAQATAAASGDGPASVATLFAAQPLYVVGVSLGAVFFGAMTYLGNGPNLMVKAIAHNAGVHCPTFAGFLGKYSLPVLLPILALSGWLFL